MTDHLPVVKVGVVQATPILFDREATLQKACRLTDEAARQGARLILFPEAFIPAYPRGLGFGTVVGSRTPEGRKTWQRYWANAVEVPGPATEELGKAAREAGVYVAIGVIGGKAGTAAEPSTAPCSTSARTDAFSPSTASSSPRQGSA